MLYDPDTSTLRVIEVKMGDAPLTPNQGIVYPQIADGTATMNATQLDALGLNPNYAGQPIGTIPGVTHIVVEEIRR